MKEEEGGAARVNLIKLRPLGLRVEGLNFKKME